MTLKAATKACKICGGTFSHAELVPDKTYKDGFRPMCRPCKAIKQTEQRQSRKKADARVAKAEVNDRKEMPNLVPPRTFNYLKSNETWAGHTEKFFVRNSGLKHIPSRGTAA